MAAFDDRLRLLLAGPGQSSALLVRSFLYGLRAGLAELPPDDQGVEEAAALVTAIGDLLDGHPPITPALAAPAPAPVVPVADVQPPDALLNALAELRDAVLRDTGEPAAAGPHDDAAQVWTTLHLATLRLPRADAETVRDQAAEIAGRNGAVLTTPAPEDTVAGLTSERLVPGLRIADQVVAPGLSVSPAGRPHPLLRPAGSDVATAPLHALAGQVLTLAERDPWLRHCLQVLEFLGLCELAKPAERRKFGDHLVRRQHAAAGAEPYTAEWLDALVRLHEAVCSAVHLPPAPDDSWWGERRTACHQALAAAARATPDGSVKFPPARYKGVGDLTRQDIAIQLPQRSGQVLACVKAWSRIGGAESQGRVIYAG
ncbi:hypothetical protein Aph01nite_42270 [Acrocarpospora phusangensis]|uniref:Uncharacterized protein n=1 Tax=Acrocarpospora phusangensis TaxID=1070424 RepID=A0A919QGR1_9ACTN|nr:hypothetical protein [Acrocarpospora phusangensis]GIH25917.1 hypothetical protein Aph01nite_42270 [Acrocarpospora phusangensis]